MPTYQELMQEVARIQEQAELARRAEAKDAIAKIREMVSTYEIRPEDIFGNIAGRKVRARSDIASTYRDETGRTWSGRGPRPKWIRDALAQGKKLDELRS